jgi:methylated-DNA-[protein]-cysteine S-methyltransferase
MNHYHLFDTELGLCGIAWSDDGVTRFQLPASEHEATRRLAKCAAPSAPPPDIAETVEQSCRYFAGEQPDFSAVPLDLAGVDAFRRQIYDVLRTVGWGRTLTYGELAAKIGAEGGAQAVGQAMGKNPIPLIIPCHRVLAAGGKIGGFSAPGGADTKERMLALEGVFINNQPRLL